MPHAGATARRLFELVEPIGMIPYFRPEPDEALGALGLHGWDAYFAGRAAPFGTGAPATLVDAVFYSFAPGEVARHIPRVWGIAAPDDVLAARRQGCVTALRALLGAGAEHPRIGRATDTLLRVATGACAAGRPVHAALRAVPVPDEPLARLWRAADLMREHRGDGHNIALLVEGIGGTEAHVLRALSDGTPPHEDGRLTHLPADRLGAVVAGMRERGLVGTDGRLTAAGRAAKQRVEALTDRLAEPPYTALAADALEQLVTDLRPIAEPVDRAIREAFGPGGP